MQLNMEDFRKQPASHVISLGPRCSTAYNLRRHFNFDAAYPFDWWITEAAGVARLLQNPDLDDLYDPAKLERTWRNGSVRHRELGLLLHHEFPRNYELEEDPVAEDFRDHIQPPKDRTRFLFERLFALDKVGNRLLFVTEADEAGELAKALETAFPTAKWHLAIVQGPQEEPVFGWKCDPAAWDAVLSGLGVTLDPSRHKPFKDD